MQQIYVKLMNWLQGVYNLSYKTQSEFKETELLFKNIFSP